MDEPPIACTLGADQVDERLAQWRRTFAAASAREVIEGGTRLRFAQDVDVAELARLAATELDCCRFFTFVLTLDDAGVTLEVTGPPGASPVDLLFA